MKKAEFLPSLYTHNAIIDAQHQELINTINKLYEAIDSGKATDEAKNALAFLMQYTVFHFGGEEKLMQEDKYPLFTEHKAAHDAFVETVKGLYQKLMEEGATEDFADQVEQEITNWLIVHIKGMDLKMIEWKNHRSGNQMDNLM